MECVENKKYLAFSVFLKYHTAYIFTWKKN